MPEYRVVWEIDLDARNPKEAAREALKILRDPSSLALFFTTFKYKDGLYDKSPPIGIDLSNYN